MTRRDLEARYANTRHWPLPPSDIPGGVCDCGATYMDNDAGHDSHEIVFGHRPESDRPASRSGGAIRAGDPADEGESPIQRRSYPPDRQSADQSHRVQAADPDSASTAAERPGAVLHSGIDGEPYTGGRDPTAHPGQDPDRDEERK